MHYPYNLANDQEAQIPIFWHPPALSSWGTTTYMEGYHICVSSTTTKTAAGTPLSWHWLADSLQSELKSSG